MPIAGERDRDREVQIDLAESLDLIALRYHDVFAVAGVVVDNVCLASRRRVGSRLRHLRHQRSRQAGEG